MTQNKIAKVQIGEQKLYNKDWYKRPGSKQLKHKDPFLRPREFSILISHWCGENG